MTRGGKREGAGKFSRGLPVIKVTLYRNDHEKLTNIVKNLEIKIPVVELIHRIVRHKDFENIVESIKQNIDKNWHEQSID